MEIDIKKVQAAYNTASRETQRVLSGLFPELNIKDKIKTFEDACYALDRQHPFLQGWIDYNHCVKGVKDSNLEAYLKLRIICAALNEGWKPQFTEDEWRYYPQFWLFSKEEVEHIDDDKKIYRHLISTDNYLCDAVGIGFALTSRMPSTESGPIGSCLCLKTEDLANYCGRQFIDIWADYLLIRK